MEIWNFKWKYEFLFIVSVRFSAIIDKYTAQERCVALCLLRGVAFPFDWSGESVWPLSLPCSQRSSPAFGPEGTYWAALVSYFRRLLYMLSSWQHGGLPIRLSYAAVTVQVLKKKKKLSLDPDSWNLWPSFPKSWDWLGKLDYFFLSDCIKF